MKHGQNDRNGRKSLLFIDTDRDTTSVIPYGNHIARVDIDLDMGTVTCKRLVYRVIDDFIDKVMKSSRSGRADIHTGTHTDGLETLKNLNGVGVILLRNGSIHRFDFFFDDFRYRLLGIFLSVYVFVLVFVHVQNIPPLFNSDVRY